MDSNILNPLSEKHLIDIIEKTKDHHPNFALFLGAGASITSGVKSAKEMVEEWRKQHYIQFSIDSEKDPLDKQKLDNHLKKYHWYNSPAEYSNLFESLYDQSSQRREYIESCLKNAFPSWGYIYLVNLIRNKVFNIILTTNFDDLLNEACHQFSTDVRPMVCAHDSSIRSLRITSNRPKIIKLHGDFLFDNLKNTAHELETLETNIRDKLKYIIAEFGLIVLGYAGNDRSIMDTLNILLNNDNNFPHGLYWCIPKGKINDISQRIQLIVRYPKVKLIEIDGFDEFIANLNGDLGLELQPEISDPYGVLTSKLNMLLEKTKIPDKNIHSVLKKDINNLAIKVQEMLYNFVPNATDSKAVKKAKPDTEKSKEFVPYSFLAKIKERENKLKDALNYILMQLKMKPNVDDFVYAFKLLDKYENVDEFLDTVLKLTNEAKGIFCTHPFALNNIGVSLIRMKKYKEANEVLVIALDIYQKSDKKAEDFIPYVRINQMQIERHQGNSLSKNELDYLKLLTQIGPRLTRLGALILLDNKNEAIELLQEVLDQNIITQEIFVEWPIFRLLPVNLNNEGKVNIDLFNHNDTISEKNGPNIVKNGI